MALQLSGITHRYTRRKVALRDLSVTVPAGVLAVLGPNGAGKSTLFSIVGTVLRPTEGHFRLLEMDSRKKRDVETMRAAIGVLPQGLQIDPGYRCEDFLSYVAWLKRIPASQSRRRVIEALDAVGLGDQARIKVSQLSGGMRQRLGLAQAILNQPKVLLLDEPTVGLDPSQRRAFRDWLIASRGDRELTLLSSHLVEDVAALADNVLVVNEGRVLFAGSLFNLCETPHPDGEQIAASYERIIAAPQEHT